MSILKRPYLWAAAGIALTATVACNRADNAPEPSSSQSSTAPASPSGTASADRPAVAGAASGAAAGNPSPGSGMAGVSASSVGPVAGAERAFVAAAANNSLAEIEAGRLVAGRTSDGAMKSFAQQMEREHTSTNDELKRIASQKGIDLPSSVEGDSRGQLNQLNSLLAADLDRAFLQSFGIDAHRRAISLFERQAREGQDPDLKAFAERTLPKLREHLAMAQQMQGGQVGSAGTSGR